MKPGSRLAPGNWITGQPSGTASVTPAMARPSMSTAVPAAHWPARASNTRAPSTARRELAVETVGTVGMGISAPSRSARQPPELGVHLLIGILRQCAVQLVADHRDLVDLPGQPERRQLLSEVVLVGLDG